ncbi:MAG TPA: NAD(P)-binding domain-containing protein, partial [Acidimicrobiales bacterium]
MVRFTKGSSGPVSPLTVGIIGGTGPAGSGLGVRLANAGHTVLLGSRDAERARSVVDDLRGRWGERVASIAGVVNRDATAADIVV